MSGTITVYEPQERPFDLAAHGNILPLPNVERLDFYVHGRDEVTYELTVKSPYAKQALTLSSTVDADEYGFEVTNEDGKDVGIHFSNADFVMLTDEDSREWTCRELMEAVSKIAVKENLGG